MKNLLLLLLFFCAVRSNGQITVTLVLPDNCNANTSIENPREEITKILKITPNPNQGCFYLYAEFDVEIGKARIVISDLNGHDVFSERIYCNSKMFVRQIAPGILTPGAYIVKLET
jgi:hypothetical protein